MFYFTWKLEVVSNILSTIAIIRYQITSSIPMLETWTITMEMIFKNQQEFDFFMIAREISKSDFFVSFYKRQRKITLWSRNRSYWITSNGDISSYQQKFRSFIFLHLPWTAVLFLVSTIWLKQTVLQTTYTYQGMENCQFSEATVCRCSAK